VRARIVGSGEQVDEQLRQEIIVCALNE
jgi:hypothetical protein